MGGAGTESRSLRPTSLDASALKSLSHLANVQGGVTRDVKHDIGTARGLADSGAIDFKVELNVIGKGELVAGGEADLSTSTDSAVKDSDTVAVLDENGVVHGVRNVDGTDLGATRLRDTKDTTAASLGDDLVDEDVGLVPAVELSVLVGEAEGSVSSAGAGVVSVYKADLCVGRHLEEETALADVTRDDLVDGEAVNVPGLDGVATSASHANRVHLHVLICGLVAVETDSDTSAEVHDNLAEREVGGAVEMHGKVGGAGKAQIGDRDTRGVQRLDAALPSFVAEINGAAALENLPAADRDDVGANGTRSHHGDALTAGDGAERSINGGKVV